jgi:hypothetical protein
MPTEPIPSAPPADGDLEPKQTTGIAEPISEPAFNLARPITGNLEFYRATLRTMRSMGSVGPKPPRLVRLIGKVWIPADLVGIIGMVFFSQSPIFLDWAIVAGIAPKLILETLSFVRLFPARLLGHPVSRGGLGSQMIILAYLIGLGLGLPIAAAAPLVLVLVLWRLVRANGGVANTMSLVWRTSASMAAAQKAAKDAPAGADVVPPLRRRWRVTDTSPDEGGPSKPAN